MFDIVSSDVRILWLYIIMDRIYKYNQMLAISQMVEDIFN